MNNRILEIVTDHKNAIKAIKSWARDWNACNGKGRMLVSKSGLYASDSDGSGEFYEAYCININEVASSADEIYEIRTNW